MDPPVPPFSSSAITANQQYRIYSGGAGSATSTGGVTESGQIGSATVRAASALRFGHDVPMAEVLAGLLVGLVFTAVGTALGWFLLFVLKRTQKRKQVDCPNCGKPGGQRATPSGRGATLAMFAVVALTLLLVCGVPYFSLTAIFAVTNDLTISPTSTVVHIVGLAACVALGWGAITYVNWYRSFPLVACACGWRRPTDPEAPQPQVSAES